MQRIAPAEFQQLVPVDGDPICAIFTKFRKFQILFWRWWRYRYDDDLAFNPAFTSEVCFAIENYCGGALSDPQSIINAGARDVSAVPPSPSELQGLIPTLNSPFCEAFVPNLTQWMQRVTDAIASEYSESLEFSPEFVAKLCALDCGGGGGGGGGGGSTCPTVTVTGTAKSRSTHLLLTWTALLATSGYGWSLYRRTDPLAAWGVAIATGTTVGNIVTYDDTGLVNDTTYYYKLTVQKPTCDPYSGELSATPRECQTYNIRVFGQSATPGAINCTIYDLDGEVQDGTAWQLFLGLVGQGPGTLIASGVWGMDDPCTPNQFPGVCKVVNVPAYAGKTCVLTAVLNQGGSCSNYTTTQSPVEVMAAPLPAPIIRFANPQNTLVTFAAVPGALVYEVFGREIGSCFPDADYHPLFQTNSTNFATNSTAFYSTDNQGGALWLRHWSIYVVAHGAGQGAISQPSNPLLLHITGNSGCQR